MGSLATQGGFPGVSPFDDDEARHRRQLALVVSNVLAGKMNNTGSLTITASAATTTLTDPRIGAYSLIFLMPTSSNAAAALPNIYYDTFAKGSCVVHHANNAQADRTFRYAVIG